MQDFMLGLFFCSLVAWGGTVSYFKHKEELARIRAKDVDISPAMVEELESLRRQIAEVGDRATQFDISFDAAISHLERRVTRVEGQEAVVSRATTASYATGGAATDHATDSPVLIRNGGQ